MPDRLERAMTNRKCLAESEESFAGNVVPFRPAGTLRRGGAQTRYSEANAVELEPLELRLARRVERVLAALLYHAVFEPDDPCGERSSSSEQRVSQLVSHERMVAIARAAICHGLTADLTRLAAAVIVFELQAQARWWNRMLRPLSARRRQIHDDTMAIADLLAWDLHALRLRPIDQFAPFL